MELATSKSIDYPSEGLCRAAPRRELHDLFADAKPAMRAELLMLVQVMYLRCGGVVLSLASIALAEGGGLSRHVAEQQRVVVVGGGDEHRHAFDDDVSHDATDHHGRALVPAMHVLLLVQVTHWPNGNKDFFTGET
uniref:Uncharacterized protein n=1 Tax=Oryza meridionalis TaxID=40149 RepID=A0A0E0CJL4_9ORYZ